ncbi:MULTISPECIES: NADH-quinone oxidoreductase subunit C [unclassified Streptomyces]|uniref:NADH-quinone oxidoreductase subunit C n=1 Tax=unclassified Streptomyces TaxID=2593676 RepID=UPI0029A1C36B|nr:MULTISPECIES: NADH-quinone oxidoreductase subunit C [unclassified Streptomyces]MDX3769420.1 NADH-quinone oxidoreductase subunit C [Streptomyces sp. AK08-01B]MDX3819651.1 NADH-quinone oxidoreductase subunit C [Streptomyces sp. AK08-01A]
MTSTPAADAYDSLPDAVTELFGEDATAEHAYDLLTVDVPAAAWIAALETARDRLGCTYFDWLSAVDEPGTGFRVCAHVAAPAHGKVRRLLIRTTVPHDAAVLPTAVGVYSGAAWHERETHEMFGIGFEGHPHLVPLLLPEGFEGHPLRKDFVLAARVAKAWPGAKEPGESEHGGPKRRTMLPPGVPDPNEWGPLKGQLPPAPTRPARTPRAAGERPVRRARSVSDGSASQQPEAAAPAASTETTPPTAPPRRTRSASQGSASQLGETAAPQRGATEPAATEPAATQSAPAPAEPAPAPRSTDAPWHNARPAFDETQEEDSSRTVGRTEEPGVSQPLGTSQEPGTAQEPGTSQPLRRSRSEGPGAEPPVREEAGREEAPRSGPATDTPDASDEPEPPARPGTSDEPEPPAQPDTPNPDPAPEPTPNPPAGGDTA